MKTFFKTMLASFGGVSDLQTPAGWLLETVGARTVSGEAVSPSLAMGLSAVYACVRVISSDVMKLPVDVYEDSDIGAVDVESPEAELVEYLFNEIANPDMSAQSFKQCMEMAKQGWGNGYAEIQRNGMGDPVALWPIHPSRVQILRMNGGDLFYRVNFQQQDLRPDNQSYVTFPQADIFHIHGMSENGVLGISPIMTCKELMGGALAIQKFANAYLANGSNPGGVLRHPAQLKPDVYERLRRSWNEVHSGAQKAGKVAILEQGLEYTPINSVSPEAAQLLQTQEFKVEEIARAFGVPPHKIQQNKNPIGYNGLEQAETSYVRDCLHPNALHWEGEIKRKFFAEQPGICARFDMSELLRGDHTARAAYYVSRMNTGSITPNQIRLLEGENPSDDDALNQYYMQGAMKTLPQIANPPAPVAPPAAPVSQPEGPADKATEPAGEPKDGAAALSSQLPIVEDALGRVATKEGKQVDSLARKFATHRAGFLAALHEFMGTQAVYTMAVLQPICKANDIDQGRVHDWCQPKYIRDVNEWLAAFDAGTVASQIDKRTGYALTDAAELIEKAKEWKR